MGLRELHILKRLTKIIIIKIKQHEKKIYYSVSSIIYADDKFRLGTNENSNQLDGE